MLIAKIVLAINNNQIESAFATFTSFKQYANSRYSFKIEPVFSMLN